MDLRESYSLTGVHSIYNKRSLDVQAPFYYAILTVDYCFNTKRFVITVFSGLAEGGGKHLLLHRYASFVAKIKTKLNWVLIFPSGLAGPGETPQ